MQQKVEDFVSGIQNNEQQTFGNGAMGLGGLFRPMPMTLGNPMGIRIPDQDVFSRPGYRGPQPGSGVKMNLLGGIGGMGGMLD